MMQLARIFSSEGSNLEDYLGVQIVQVMMARKPGWDSQQLLKVWRNNLQRELQRRN